MSDSSDSIIPPSDEFSSSEMETSFADILALWKSSIYTRGEPRDILYSVDEAQVKASFIELENKLVDLIGTVAGDVTQTLVAREVIDQEQGGWIEDPVALFEEGSGFGDERSQRGSGMRVNICLDSSGSMYTADGLYYNGHYVATGVSPLGEKDPILLLPRMLIASLLARKFLLGLWDVAGTLGQDRLEVKAYCFAVGGGGKDTSQYKGDVWLKHPRQGGSTPLIYLLRKLLEEERNDGFYGPKVDLILTDGIFHHNKDACDEIQLDREALGQVMSVVMNIVPEDSFKFGAMMYSLDDKGYGYGGDADRKLPKRFTPLAAQGPQELARFMTMSLREFFANM